MANQHDFTCPKCGHDGDIGILAEKWVMLSENGTDIRDVSAEDKIDALDKIMKLDGPLFRKQRQAILGLMTGEAFVSDVQEELEGLQNLLDAIADIAHDSYGIDCLLCDDEENEDGNALRLHGGISGNLPAVNGKEEVNPELVREFLLDVMTTAVEGGINYCADINPLHRNDNLDVEYFTVKDNEDDDAEPKEITADKVHAAIMIIIAPDNTMVLISDRIKNDIREAWAKLDAGMIDAELADCIIQVAAYGEIVFG